MKRREILESAIKCVCQDRQDVHGAPENTFATIAGLWSAYLRTEVAPHDVANLMVLFKVARSQANPQHDDNGIDAAGYAALSAELSPATSAAPRAAPVSAQTGSYRDLTQQPPREPSLQA